MATYDQIAGFYSQSIHENKIRVAIADVALRIAAETEIVPNHAERLNWAARAMSNPGGESDRFLIGVLTANRQATVAQIENADDASIQTNVDALVDIFAVADSLTNNTSV